MDRDITEEEVGGPPPGRIRRGKAVVPYSSPSEHAIENGSDQMLKDGASAYETSPASAPSSFRKPTYSRILPRLPRLVRPPTSGRRFLFPFARLNQRFQHMLR